jgi:hypothetical protein
MKNIFFLPIFFILFVNAQDNSLIIKSIYEFYFDLEDDKCIGKLFSTKSFDSLSNESKQITYCVDDFSDIICSQEHKIEIVNSYS